MIGDDGEYSLKHNAQLMVKDNGSLRVKMLFELLSAHGLHRKQVLPANTNATGLGRREC